jgi:hypothetical protein
MPAASSGATLARLVSWSLRGPDAASRVLSVLISAEARTIITSNGRSELMKAGWRSIFAMTIAGLLLLISDVPSDAARRVARGSSYDGTWSVAIYTLRGDCGSLRAALRIIGGRVYSGDGSYQAYGAVGAGGAIRVTVISGGQAASGSGRLSSNSRAGRWRTARGECFGTWSATRSAAYY